MYSGCPFYLDKVMYPGSPFHLDNICAVLCFLGVPQKNAGRKTMKIGGSGVPRTLTGSPMVTKRIK